jgi:Gpi18-like mannosyltransferase
LVIAAALVVRMALMPFHAYLPGGSMDEHFWTAWMQAIHEHGVLNVFTTTTTNYVGYQWVLYALSTFYGWAGGSYSDPGPGLHLLVKTPSVLADVLLIVVMWHATSALISDDARKRRLAVTAAAVIAFQPAVLYDGAIWAQTDASISVAMLAALLLASRGRPGWAWAVWTAGFLIKPQPVLLLPVLLVLTLRTSGLRGMLRGATAGAGVTAVVLGPWILHGDLHRVTTAYGALMGSDYGRLSVSAWNTWWFADRFTHAAPEDPVAVLPFMTYRVLGMLLSLCAGTLAAGYLWARTDLRRALIAGAYMAFAFYMLPMSTHERYLFPFLVLLLPVAVIERRWLWLYVPASATLFLNMFVIAPSASSWSGRWVDAPFIWSVAGLNVAVFATFSVIVASGARGALPHVRAYVMSNYPFNRIATSQRATAVLSETRS